MSNLLHTIVHGVLKIILISEKLEARSPLVLWLYNMIKLVWPWQEMRVRLERREFFILTASIEKWPCSLWDYTGVQPALWSTKQVQRGERWGSLWAKVLLGLWGGVGIYWYQGISLGGSKKPGKWKKENGLQSWIFLFSIKAYELVGMWVQNQDSGNEAPKFELKMEGFKTHHFNSCCSYLSLKSVMESLPSCLIAVIWVFSHFLG
jgi:hypothetical protein